MKGCTNALRLIFGGDFGSDREGEFVEINGAAVHLFECFALVNFLLCSAVSEDAGRIAEMRRPGGKPGRSSPTMRRNCARHFTEALQFLIPLIIAQGMGVGQWMRQAFALPVHAPPTCVELMKIRARDTVLVSLTHPSARQPYNWGQSDRTPYLLETVAPAIRTGLALSFEQQAPGLIDIGPGDSTGGL